MSMALVKFGHRPTKHADLTSSAAVVSTAEPAAEAAAETDAAAAETAAEVAVAEAAVAEAPAAGMTTS
jgi:hypothetical protein